MGLKNLTNPRINTSRKPYGLHRIIGYKRGMKKETLMFHSELHRDLALKFCRENPRYIRVTPFSDERTLNQ